MMRNCTTVQRSLGAWLDAELGEAERQEIREHLEKCPSCLAEKRRLERLQSALGEALRARASGIAFEPFWREVQRRISEREIPWHARFWDWVRSILYPQRLAWVVPVAMVFLVGAFSLREFFPGWLSGSQRTARTVVDSIDGHGLNVALFRESESRTTVIWLFEDHEEEDEASGSSTQGNPF